MGMMGAIATGPMGATATGVPGRTGVAGRIATLPVGSPSSAGTLSASSSRAALWLFCNTVGAGGAVCCAGAQTAKHCRANPRHNPGSFLVGEAIGARSSKGRAGAFERSLTRVSSLSAGSRQSEDASPCVCAGSIRSKPHSRCVGAGSIGCSNATGCGCTGSKPDATDAHCVGTGSGPHVSSVTELKRRV
jgi:hypothetical protein